MCTARIAFSGTGSISAIYQTHTYWPVPVCRHTACQCILVFRQGRKRGFRGKGVGGTEEEGRRTKQDSQYRIVLVFRPGLGTGMVRYTERYTQVYRAVHLGIPSTVALLQCYSVLLQCYSVLGPITVSPRTDIPVGPIRTARTGRYGSVRQTLDKMISWYYFSPFVLMFQLCKNKNYFSVVIYEESQYYVIEEKFKLWRSRG